MGYDRFRREVHCVDEGLIAVPFCFTINGTSNPDAVLGDEITSRAVTRVSAGLFTFVLFNKPYAVIGASCVIAGGAAEDIYAQLDASAATSTGVITVRTKTGATATDPADNDIVYGVLYCKMTDRRANG